jgi:hypothetical protein
MHRRDGQCRPEALMPMQVERPDEGGQQQLALNRTGLHGMKIATSPFHDHKSFRPNRTFNRVHELELRIQGAEVPRFAAKGVVVQQQVKPGAGSKLQQANAPYTRGADKIK